MLHVGGCKGIDLNCFSKLMDHAKMLKSLCLRSTEVVDDVLFKFIGSSLELLDVSDTKVSGAGVAHVIGRNPGLKCLKTRGCSKLSIRIPKTFSSKLEGTAVWMKLVLGGDFHTCLSRL